MYLNKTGLLIRSGKVFTSFIIKYHNKRIDISLNGCYLLVCMNLLPYKVKYVTFLFTYDGYLFILDDEKNDTFYIIK